MDEIWIDKGSGTVLGGGGRWRGRQWGEGGGREEGGGGGREAQKQV